MLQRNAGTVLSEAGQDRGRVFDFADAEAPGQHKVVDMLEELEPGSEVPISQTFRVSDRAFPYSEAHLKLELMLSEPSRDPSLHSGLATDHQELSQLRSVAWYGQFLSNSPSILQRPPCYMNCSSYCISVIRDRVKTKPESRRAMLDSAAVAWTSSSFFLRLTPNTFHFSVQVR
jgi:hypothetical protein